MGGLVGAGVTDWGTGWAFGTLSPAEPAGTAGGCWVLDEAGGAVWSWADAVLAIRQKARAVRMWRMAAG
jgi:hypothetical protein